VQKKRSSKAENALVLSGSDTYKSVNNKEGVQRYSIDVRRIFTGYSLIQNLSVNSTRWPSPP